MSGNIDLERKLKTFIKQISTYAKAVRKEPVDCQRGVCRRRDRDRDRL